MGLKVFINGELVEKDDARISVFDHGFLYGDGVFEGIRIYGGAAFKLDEHIERLFRSAKAIMLDIPTSREELKKAVRKTMAANGLSEGYIRLVVSRGVGTLGLNPFSCHDPCVIVITDTISLYPPETYKNGLEVMTVATVRNIPEALNPRIKSLNYLNNILAKIEAQNAGCMEAIMLNAKGFVAEASGDNIFVVQEGVLLTPGVNAGALEGITRGIVIELARETGREVREADLTRYDIFTADECFLTGTAAEIVPVVKVDGRTIGDGKPGPVTLDLLKRFHKLTGKLGRKGA